VMHAFLLRHRCGSWSPILQVKLIWQVQYIKTPLFPTIEAGTQIEKRIVIWATSKTSTITVLTCT
jgi:hypothetical protein